MGHLGKVANRIGEDRFAVCCEAILSDAILSPSCPEPEGRNIKLAVILSERGPERLSVRGW